MMPWSACSGRARNTRWNPTGSAAIALAIREARPGDIVLLAGKGHEKVQITQRRRHSLRRRAGGARSACVRQVMTATASRPPEGKRMKLPLDESPNFCRPRGEFDHKAVAQGYSIDSRTVQPGEVVLRGQRRTLGWPRLRGAGAGEGRSRARSSAKIRLARYPRENPAAGGR